MRVEKQSLSADDRSSPRYAREKLAYASTPEWLLPVFRARVVSPKFKIRQRHT